MLTLDTTTYLGPATILQTNGGRVKLELPDAHVWARCALAFPYQPAIGDVVLAVGRPDQWYVIGVVEGRGVTKLTVPGDLALSAPRGRVTIEAGQGIDLKSSEVRVVASRLETIVDTVLERFTEATRWVASTFQLRVGRLRTRVDETYDLRAKQIRVNAQENVAIDGARIDLG